MLRRSKPQLITKDRRQDLSVIRQGECVTRENLLLKLLYPLNHLGRCRANGRILPTVQYYPHTSGELWIAVSKPTRVRQHSLFVCRFTDTLYGQQNLNGIKAERTHTRHNVTRTG